MRLGIVGLIPSDFHTVDDTLARYIRSLGFSGVGAHIAGDPLAASPAALQHLRAVLDANGLRLVQFWGWYPSIVTDDESLRRTGVRAAQEIVKLGASVGAQMIGIRPTSMSPNGPWSPHPLNYAPATEERLVKSLREIAAACADYQLAIALECHVTTTLHSPEASRRIIERVGSDWIKVNLDPVNFVRDHLTAYDMTGLLNDLFDTLGSYALAAHIKDVRVDDDHVVHISETPPGTGLMDFETLFRRFEALLPDGFALIEHLPPEQVPDAAAFVQQKLRDLNITVKD
jgi:sugar phosphate isomerase/epimerase